MENNISICFVLNALYHGGTEYQTLSLAKELFKKGYKILIISIKSEQEIELSEFKKYMDFYSIGAHRFLSVKVLKKILYIRKLLKDRKVKIIQGASAPADILAGILGIVSKIKARMGLRYLETPINIRDKICFFISPILNKLIFHVSPSIKSKNIFNRRIFVIPNGIDTSRFYPGKNLALCNRLGIKKDEIIIGTVGRLTPEKGHIFLIKSAYELVKNRSNLKFFIAGDGILMETLKSQVKELGLENHVIFLGARNDIPEILRIFDIFVLPSLTEGHPLALLEAMATGLPIIATNVGGIPYTIEHKKSGILIPPKNVKKLVDYILYLIENPELRKFLGENARNRALKEYSVENMVKKYASIYKTFAKE